MEHTQGTIHIYQSSVSHGLSPGDTVKPEDLEERAAHYFLQILLATALKHDSGDHGYVPAGTHNALSEITTEIYLMVEVE